MTKPAILEPELAPYFTTKAPFQFPVEFREAFVKYWPIASLVLIALAIPGFLILFGLGTAISMSVGAGMGTFIFISTLVSLAATVLSAIALPGLFNRKRQGWVLSYYAQLVSVVALLLSLSIVGILLGGLLRLLFLMLLFQVRDYYSDSLIPPPPPNQF